MHSPTLRNLARFSVYAALTDMASSIRRTVLGPLWSTLGLALAIACLSLFFGSVLKQQLPDYETYTPFVAAGMIAWTFWASCVHQSCSLVWGFLNSLRHNRMTLLVPVLRVMVQNFVLLNINVIIGLLTYWLYFDALPTKIWMLLCGIALLVANTFWISYVAALACARFRDLPQLIAWGIHLAFFLTPILWVETNLGRFKYLADISPFAGLIALLRGPLLGEPIEPGIWIGAIVFAILGALLCRWLGRRTARRLPYWL